MIYICSLAEVLKHASTLRPTHVVSLLGDDPFPDTPEWIEARRHLRIRVHDIGEPAEGLIHPDEEHVADLIRFGEEWARTGPVLIHCYAGISRSTAAALTLCVQHNIGRERDAARLLRRRAPHAQPNRLMIGLADRMLGCEGRLVSAVQEIGLAEYRGPGCLVELPLELPLALDEA
jgi:predicted protein tyrosine phosphatase